MLELMERPTIATYEVSATLAIACARLDGRDPAQRRRVDAAHWLLDVVAGYGTEPQAHTLDAPRARSELLTEVNVWIREIRDTDPRLTIALEIARDQAHAEALR